jgi:precorrin-3B synthase
MLQLTSRAGLQIRGLPDPLPSGFVDAVAATGLLPAPTHERVRNIVASPLTGLSGGLTDLSPMTAALDAGLIAEPALADLPGRFLFVLDDGRGDLVDLVFDLGYQATGADRGFVLVGSADRGFPVAAIDAVPTLLRLARRFGSTRRASGAWRVSELPGWADTLGAGPLRPVRGTPAVPLGRIGDAASVAVPLARLGADQARVVADLAVADPIVVTPWRGLVLPSAGGHLAELARAGLIVDDDAAWAQLSACVGAPFCARARIDTAELARSLATGGHGLPRIHVSGCERRCGAPAGAHIDLVAPNPPEAAEAIRS